LEGVDVSFSFFLCAREKYRLGFGEKVEALLAKRVGRSKKRLRGLGDQKIRWN
jgi:hypothetical protein